MIDRMTVRDDRWRDCCDMPQEYVGHDGRTGSRWQVCLMRRITRISGCASTCSSVCSISGVGPGDPRVELHVGQLMRRDARHFQKVQPARVVVQRLEQRGA